MTTNSIRYVTAFLALTSGILAVGDKLVSMPGLPGWLTSAWPVILIFASIFNHSANILITPSDSVTTKPQQAPTVPPAVPVLVAAGCLAMLSGCAGQPQPTPEQLAAYQQLAQSSIQGGLKDYKDIKAATK